MSRTRRNFSAEFKSDLVLEVLKGEKELNVIATENNIQPNLLRIKYEEAYLTERHNIKEARPASRNGWGLFTTGRFENGVNIYRLPL